jgi:hypothetical protein
MSVLDIGRYCALLHKDVCLLPAKVKDPVKGSVKGPVSISDKTGSMGRHL